jgi:hypothetical protein
LRETKKKVFLKFFTINKNMSHYNKDLQNQKEDAGGNEAESQDDSLFVKLFKCLCCPVILLFMSIKIYFCGCLAAKCQECLHSVQHCICCGVWRDSEFLPNDNSIGKQSGYEWKPLSEVCVDMYYDDLKASGKKIDKAEIKPCMVEGQPEPNDLIQGALGSCWLLSAISAVAEHPGLLMGKFMRTHAYNPYGKYTFQIYNATEGVDDWEEVEIDDLVPVRHGRTAFANPKNNEMWAALAEKAFAKWAGTNPKTGKFEGGAGSGYEAIDGGSSAWALTALTGGRCWVYIRENGKWKRWGLSFEPTANDRRASSLRRNQKFGAPPPVSDDEFWKMLLDYDDRKSVMCCSVVGGDDSEYTAEGLTMGHAYTLVSVVEIQGFRMCRVRNPWGSGAKKGEGEWTGAWSDNDSKWQQHNDVKKKLCPDGFKDDGIFFMEFKDFARNFQNVQICTRSTGFKDLVLIQDGNAMCPVFQGCLKGCCEFYCCCGGVKALCCAENRKD